MSYDRVIQDSDDEDDPLSEVPPAIDPPQILAEHEGDNIHSVNADQKNSVVKDHGRDDNHGNHISVNFDDFLQSQEAAHPLLSSSQQRREERWIPNAVGGGSIGSMMTEIGLAQRRLFDDDETQYAEHHIPQVHTFSESLQFNSGLNSDVHVPPRMAGPDNNEIPNGYMGLGTRPSEPEMHIPNLHPNAFATTAFQNIDAHISNSERIGHTYSTDGIVGYYGDHIPHAAPQSSVSHHDYAQSSIPYNIFESSSSLNLPSGSNTNNHALCQSNGTMHKSPRRSNSMQPTPYSPHDTEPISSLISPQVSRAKSDNAGRNPLQQSQRSACDELAIPVGMDLPIVKKKRGRPKKQDIPVDSEDDELAGSNDHGVIGQSDQSNKRKPGRPSLNARTKDVERDGNNSDSVHQQDTSAPILEDIQTNDVSTEANRVQVVIDGVSHTLNEHNRVRVEASDISKDSQANFPKDTSTSESIRFAEPSKKTIKEPKKRKLKRGKTTSVTVKKTYESDVEDDVIWVDERPSNTLFQKENCDVPRNNENRSETINIEIPNSGLPNAIEVNLNGNLSEVATGPNELAPPEPKKRGRKRKKTSEPVTAEEALNKENEIPNQEQPLENTTIKTDNDTSETNSNHPPETDYDPKNPQNDLETAQEETSPSTTTPTAPETPKKSDQSTTDTQAKDSTKGPDKHSPISSTSKVPYRVGLSRRARIAPLLKIVKR